MTALARLLGRFAPEYRLSLLTNYLFMAAAMAAQIILVPIYLAALGVEGFGSLNLILALITYVSIVGCNWATAGVQRLMAVAYVTQGSPDLAQIKSAAKILFTGYAALVSLAGGGLFAYFGAGTVPTSAIALASLYFIANQELHIEKLALAATGRLPMANLLQLLQLVSYSCSVIVALRSGAALPGVFACNLGSVLLTRAVIPFVSAGKRSLGPVHVGHSLRALVKMLIGRWGAGYFISSALQISSQSDVLIVGMIGGAEAAARFVLVWKLADLAIQALSRIPEMLAPILMRLDAAGDWNSVRRQYADMFKLTLAIAVPAAAGYIVFGSWILQIWLGSNYVPQGRLPFLLAGIAIVCVAAARPTVVLAESLARFRLANLVAFSALAVRIGLTLMLYRWFGYLSPLIALVIAYVCGASAAYYWVGRNLMAEIARGESCPTRSWDGRESSNATSTPRRERSDSIES